MSRLELKVPPDVVWLAVAALMWLAAVLARRLTVEVPLRLWVAVVLTACGVALIVAARVALARAHTTWAPTAPERTSSLVTGGVYRFTRNPIYLGMLLVLLAWAAVLANLLALALVAVFVAYMDRFQIGPEEAALSARLGEGYRDYRAQVRRWV